MNALLQLVAGGQSYAVLLPVFLGLVGAERLIYARSASREWDERDALVNGLITGCYLVVELIVGWLAPLAALAWLHEHGRLWTLGMDAGSWVVAFLLFDLCWYVDHRVAHRVSAFWALHQVHHSSNAYNTLVSSRGFLGDATMLTRPMFYALALFGVSPLHFVVIKIATSVWGIAQHTRLVGRLGPLDAVLATPSNHRVHHGSNPKYIDRNYGEVLIVWDRLFGTYQREEEEPTYGLTTPERSYNPLWIQVAGLAWLAARVRAARGAGEVVRSIVGPPERDVG